MEVRPIFDIKLTKGRGEINNAAEFADFARLTEIAMLLKGR